MNLVNDGKFNLGLFLSIPWRGGVNVFNNHVEHRAGDGRVRNGEDVFEPEQDEGLFKAKENVPGEEVEQAVFGPAVRGGLEQGRGRGDRFVADDGDVAALKVEDDHFLDGSQVLLAGHGLDDIFDGVFEQRGLEVVKAAGGGALAREGDNEVPLRLGLLGHFEQKRGFDTVVSVVEHKLGRSRGAAVGRARHELRGSERQVKFFTHGQRD